MNNTGGIGQAVTFPFSFLVKAKYTYRGRVLTDPLGTLAKHLKAEHSFNPTPVGDLDDLPSVPDGTDKSTSLVSGTSNPATKEDETVNQPPLPLDRMLANLQ